MDGRSPWLGMHGLDRLLTPAVFSSTGRLLTPALEGVEPLVDIPSQLMHERSAGPAPRWTDCFTRTWYGAAKVTIGRRIVPFLPGKAHMMFLLVAVVLSSPSSSVVCDGVADERDFSSWESADFNGSAASSGEEFDAAEEVRGSLDPDTASSGGITVPPAKKKCCVACQGDGWTGWYNLGLKYGTCTAEGKSFCHGNNWDFGNAEWYFTCPKK